MPETIYARYMHKRSLLISLIFLVLGAILATTAVGAQTFLEQIDEEEESIISFETEIENLEEQITNYEKQLSDIADLVAETEARIAIEDEKLALIPIYLELMADNLIDRYVSLEEPTSVRHVMAIDAYVRNDEHINAVLTQSIQLSEEALEQIRARLLYESIINDANDQLLAIYGQLRQLGREIDSLFDRRNQSNERRTLAFEDRSEAMSIVPGIEEQIDSANTNINTLRASIAKAELEIDRLRELLVAMRWTALIGEDIIRPALAFKIDNVGAARPQSGINQADVVYEELVESGLTRLVAIFQTESPSVVGPIRSARTSDPILLSGFDMPLFAYSGANQITLDIVYASDVISVNWDRASSAYWQSTTRRSPHNLYASPSQLWALNPEPERTELPPAPFEFRGSEEPLHPSAVPAERIAIDFGWTEVDYRWNGSGWTRRQGGTAHIDANGVRVAPPNMIVQFVRYGTSPAAETSPEAETVGTGVAWIFTDGHLIIGEWDRTDVSMPAIYHVEGEEIRLTPGRTWVALAEEGTASWE